MPEPKTDAPLYVPTEIRRHDSDPLGPRCFRLAVALSERRVRLRSALPEALCEGPLQVRLVLPQDDPDNKIDKEPDAAADGPLVLTGVAGEVVVDVGEETEHAEARLILLHGVPEHMRARIERYVRHRLASEQDAG